MVEPSSFDKLVGTTLGNYRLERCIMRGELGPTFLAHADKGSTSYLLRVLAVPTELTAEARIVYLGRFQQEANQVATLQQTYIHPLSDYGNQQGMPYLVFPYLAATSLSALLAQKGPLDVLTASRYLDQVAAALEYAHEHAILHRNLTTDCIFVKSDGNLVVADFGMMRMLELSRSDTDRNLLYGTAASNSPAPEQLQGMPADTYTDVYASGAVLYRMLTGHRVFRGQTREELVQQHLQFPVPPLSMWRRDLPAEVDSLIARAMAKEPTQRFRQPGTFANVYHQVVAPNDTVRQPFISTPAPATQPQSQPAQGERIMVGAGDPAWEAGNAPALERDHKRPYVRPAASASVRGQAAISRRRALTLIGAGVGTAAVITGVALFASHYLAGTTSPTATIGNSPSSTTSTTGNKPPAQGGTVLARTADVPLNSAKTFPIANSPNPGVLVHLPDNRFVAFNSTCTHAGCAVSYNPGDKLLECPCHQAAFDPAKGAAVVAGPAPSPLAAIHISVNANGTITTP